MKTFLEYHRFILEYYAPAQKWDKLAFSMWLTVMRDAGGIVTVLNAKDEIVALACAYTVMNAADIDEQIDPEGPILFIDLAISTCKGGLQALGFALKQRFGERPQVAWRHLPFNIIKVYTLRTVRRNLFRVTKDLMAIH